MAIVGDGENHQLCFDARAHYFSAGKPSAAQQRLHVTLDGSSVLGSLLDAKPLFVNRQRMPVHSSPREFFRGVAMCTVSTLPAAPLTGYLSGDQPAITRSYSAIARSAMSCRSCVPSLEKLRGHQVADPIVDGFVDEALDGFLIRV